jgi:ABC-2 type transport system ATP-binding protein
MGARGLFFLDVSPIETVFAVLGDRARRHGEGVVADIPRHEAPALIRQLVAANVEICEARWLAPTLEEIFLSRTGVSS